MSDPTDGRRQEFGEPMDGSAEPAAIGAAPTLPSERRPSRFKRKPGSSEGTSPLARVPRPGLGSGAVIVVIAVIALAVVPVLYSSLKKTPRDRVGISYGGGPFEGAHFQRIVKPGSPLFFNGLFDPLYLYPADQQNYIISKTFGQGIVKQPDSVIAPTSDRVQVEYQVAAFFKLNIDRLQAFHEQLGLKYSAYTKGGWVNLLQDTFRQQIESSLQQETRRYTVAQLVNSASVLIKIQNQVQATISDELIASLGQQYFCGPSYEPGGKCGPITFVIKKIDPPPLVQAAFNAVAQRTNEAQSIEVLNVALKKAGQNYVLLRGIENGSIKFWVVPDGTNLAIQAPSDLANSAGGTPPAQGGPAPDGSTPTTAPGGPTTTTTPGGSTTTTVPGSTSTSAPGAISP